LCSGCNINETNTTDNYDATLISWSQQNLQPNKTIYFTYSQDSPAAEAARQKIIDDYGWTIIDGGGSSLNCLTGDGTVSSTTLPSTNMTIAWTTSEIVNLFMVLGNNYNADQPGLYYSTNQNVWWLRWSGGSLSFASGGAATGTNRWVLTAVEAGGTNACKLYRNGVLITQKTQGYTPISFTKMINGGGTTSSSKMQELVIFSDIKDQAWVTADYNNGSGKSYTSGETGIVNGWHFDEGSGTTVADFVGTSDITLSGTFTWGTSILPIIPKTYSATTTGSGDLTLTSVTG
jgi:hypothetical protein